MQMKKDRKTRIAVDMDETIVDTLSRHLDWYNNEHHSTLRKNDLQGKKIYDVVPECHVDRVKSYPNDPAFFADLRPFENAISTLDALSATHEIFIVTAAMEYPASFNAKYRWLTENLPFISPLNFVFCGVKSVIHADFLIDDSPHHLDHFHGQGLLFDAPHNYGANEYARVKDWLAIKQMFMDKQDEKPATAV